MDKFKLKTCKCGTEFKQFNSLVRFCSSSCQRQFSKPKDLKLKPLYKIPKVSEKQKALNKIYEKVRIEILSEAKFICFVDGCKNVATTCEHQMGRRGFADDWSRENNIPLMVDKRYLKPCCLFHNLEFERNPELAKQYQLSKIHGGIKE